MKTLYAFLLATLSASLAVGQAVSYTYDAMGNRTARVVGARQSAEIAEVSEETSEALTVYPNPSTGEFEARFYARPGQRATLSVTNMQGRELWQKMLTGEGKQSEKIGLSDATAGMYLLLLLRREETGRQPVTENKRVLIVK